MVYLPIYIYHKNQPNVGKYTSSMNPKGNYRSLRPNKKKHPSGLPNDGRGVPDSTGFKTTRWLNLGFSGDLLVVGNLQVFLAVFLGLSERYNFQHPEMAKNSPWRQRQAMKGNPDILGLLVKVFVSGCVPFRCVETTLRFWDHSWGNIRPQSNSRQGPKSLLTEKSLGMA